MMISFARWGNDADGPSGTMIAVRGCEVVRMSDFVRDHEFFRRSSHLGAEIVAHWLVVGATLATSVVIVVGVRRSLWIWAGSAAVLSLLLLLDALNARPTPPSRRTHD